jgi:hypothetical protein
VNEVESYFRELWLFGFITAVGMVAVVLLLVVLIVMLARQGANRV